MDDQTLRNTIHELAEKAIPAEHDPWPGIRQAVIHKNQLTYQKKVLRMTTTSHPFTRRSALRMAVVLGLVTVVAFSALLATPQGQVLAQQIASFFTRASQESIPAPLGQANESAQARFAEQGIAVPTAPAPDSYVFFESDCAGHSGSAAALCQLILAEEKAGFTVLVPGLDSGLSLSNLAYDSAEGRVQAGFSYTDYANTENSVYLMQGSGKFPEESDWQKVPAQYIQAVTVAGQPAEYVEGTFVIATGETSGSWVSDPSVARLRWRDGERWFELSKRAHPAEVTFMDKAGIIRLAESLVHLSGQP